MHLVAAKSAKQPAPYGETERAILNSGSYRTPLEFLSSCPAYAYTPLVQLEDLPRQLGIERLLVKDESHRLNLLSFKALGGVYAVGHILLDNARKILGQNITPANLLDDEVRELSSMITVVCATDGNHGKSVAAGARIFGANAVVYLPAGVTSSREEAITSQNARVIRTSLNYDDAVEAAQRAANENGWILVADTGPPGFEYIPQLVMHGYTVMVREVLEQTDIHAVTHVLVQGGVGGLAAAVVGVLADVLGKQRPVTIVVEPEGANCLQASAELQTLTKLDTLQPTLMAMLECGEPSSAAWPILSNHVDYFIDIPDSFTVAAMKLLASPRNGDERLVLGESGAAGLGGLLAIVRDHSLREAVGLSRSSVVLLIGTEGATDPGRFEELTGSSSSNLPE